MTSLHLQPSRATVAVRVRSFIAGRFALCLFLVAGALLAGGCATPNIQVGVQTRSQVYAEIRDPMEILNSSPPKCAILPTVVSGASPGLGSFVDNALGRILAGVVLRKSLHGPLGMMRFSDGPDERPDTVRSPAFVINSLNSMGLGRELQTVLGSAIPGGVLDRDGLRRIGRALEVEYLMLPWLVGVHTDNATRFAFGGITFVRTGWTTVEMTLQIWHAPSGRMVWQSTGTATLVGEGVIGTPPPVQPVFDEILIPMLVDFVEGRSESNLTDEIKKRPSDSGGASVPGAAEAQTGEGAAPANANPGDAATPAGSAPSTPTSAPD